MERPPKRGRHFMKLTLNTILAGFGFFAATIAANHYVTMYIVERELMLYAEQNQPPQIAIFDIEGYVSKKMADGADPVKTTRHLGLITLAANSTNLLLIDKKAVLSTPESFELPELTTEELEKRLKDAGVTVPTEDEYMKLFEAKKAETLKMFESAGKN